MRYLGIDYGTKGIGIAISDAAGSFAFPKEIIPSNRSALERIVALVEQEGIGAIVIGDTRALNGKDNAVTPEAERFASALAERVPVPLHSAREAWSSVEAARFAPKGKGHDDAAAAAIILQRYLDARPKTD
jgi:putative Holliday junction resolvase